MTKVRQGRGVSRAEWLETALTALTAGNVAQISIEGLARQLGIAKSGFYWHFRDRNDLLTQLLEYWTHEATEVINRNEELAAMGPKDRLQRAAEIILETNLVRYEIGIRQWAMSDKNAQRAVRRVNRERLRFLRETFRELGFEDNEAEMRAMLFACYHTWESPMFPEISWQKRRSLISRRIALLTSH